MDPYISSFNASIDPGKEIEKEKKDVHRHRMQVKLVKFSSNERELSSFKLSRLI